VFGAYEGRCVRPLNQVLGCCVARAMSMRMHTPAVVLGCVAVLLLEPAMATPPTGLPGVIESALSRRYPGWRLALPDDDVVASYARHQGRSAEQLCVVRGDFDSNGDADWAVHLLTEPDADAERLLLVYLQRRGRYWLRTLERGKADGQLSIHMTPRGTREYDFNRDQYFRLQHDAVFVYYFEKAGRSYIWRRNRFHSVATSD
jgi:hypothetical protein